MIKKFGNFKVNENSNVVGNKVYIILNEDGVMLTASLSEEDMLDSCITYSWEEFDNRIDIGDLSIKYNKKRTEYSDLTGAILKKGNKFFDFIVLDIHKKK